MPEALNSNSLFSEWVAAAAELENRRAAVSKTFHAAVIALVRENKGKSGDDVVKLYSEVVNRVLNEHFGDTDIEKHLESWAQLVSDYKSLLKLDPVAVLDCNGWGQVKTKRAEIRKAMKEKASGEHSDDTKTPGDNDSGKAESEKRGEPKTATLPESVAAKIRELEKALALMSEGQALAFAEKSVELAMGRLSNTNKKAMVAGPTVTK